MGQAKNVERSECGRFKITDMHGGSGVICWVKPGRSVIPNFKLTDLPYVNRWLVANHPPKRK